MHKIIFTLICAIGLFSLMNHVSAEDKTGILTRIYTFKLSDHRQKYTVGYYVLEDGYTLYFFTKNNKHLWNKGDALVVHDPFQDADEYEINVRVKNATHNDKSSFMRAGWASPVIYTIKNTHYEKNDGDKIVTLTLDDGSKWRITYFDEKPEAKAWKKGEKILLLVDTHEDDANNPFPLKAYPKTYEYNLINLSATLPFAGEPAYPL